MSIWIKSRSAGRNDVGIWSTGQFKALCDALVVMRRCTGGKQSRTEVARGFADCRPGADGGCAGGGGAAFVVAEAAGVSGQTAERLQHARTHVAGDRRAQLSEVIGQRKLLKWSIPGAAHAATFWGFIVLLLTIIEAY